MSSRVLSNMATQRGPEREPVTALSRLAVGHAAKLGDVV